MPWYRQLHWQIIIALLLGLIFGVIASSMGPDWIEFTKDWVKPWGTIFINLLKMIAVPIVLTSLISGVASLSDMTKLSRIGGKTLFIYVSTTIAAIIIGLFLVNTIKPGKSEALQQKVEQIKKESQVNVGGTGPDGKKDPVAEAKAKELADKQKMAEEQKKKAEEMGPLKPLIDIVPENVLGASSDNSNLLQIVFISILIGIGLIQIAPEKALPVRGFFEGLNDVFIQIANLIMKIAPLGVFALIATVITAFAKDGGVKGALDLLGVMAVYMFTVAFGLMLQVGIVYVGLLRFMSPVKIGTFFAGMRPAQLLAFSSSSSAATLPVTKECMEKNLGIDPEVTSFTLPLGATVNMDGTALYQAVAAVFIVQALGGDLSILQQITLVLLPVTLASIGTAAVPSAGIIMLVLVMNGIKLEIPGLTAETVGKLKNAMLGLVFGVDRLLDMMRTTANVTGDAVVTTAVAHSEGKLKTAEELAKELEQEGEPAK